MFSVYFGQSGKVLVTIRTDDLSYAHAWIDSIFGRYGWGGAAIKYQNRIISTRSRSNSAASA